MRHVVSLSLLGAASLCAALNARAAEVTSGSRAVEAEAVPLEGERPTAFSARLSAGSGGGAVGIAGRLGVELDYWPSEHVGIGAVGALTGEVSAQLFGGTRSSYWLVGPAVAARTDASGTHGVFSAALGYMHGQRTELGELDWWCDGACEDDEPERAEMHGLGAVLGAGFSGGDGPLNFGLLALLDVLDPAAGSELEDTQLTLTLNLTLTLGI